MSLVIDFGVLRFGQERSWFLLPHAVSLERNSMGVMDDTIEDGVSDRWFADHLVPLRDGKLGGDQSGFPAVALFEDFQEIEPLLIAERVGSPVIKDE